MNNETFYKTLLLYAIKRTDLAYLDENLTELLREEVLRSRPNIKVITILKTYIEQNKFIEIWMAAYRAYTVNTDTITWIYQRVLNISTTSPEYTALEQIIELDTKIRIWVASFYTTVNKLIYTLKIRKINAAEKLIKRLSKEMQIGKKLFLKFETAAKNYRMVMLEEKDKKIPMKLFYIE